MSKADEFLKFAASTEENRLEYQQYIRDRVRIDKKTGCWLWMRSRRHDGYGQVCVRGVTVRTHRLSFAVYDKLPVSGGDVLLHTCDNPQCCNPKHLTVGTQLTNIADMVKKRRHMIGARHHQSKLTEGDVRRIVAMLDAGRSTTSIATVYKISKSTVRHIDTGRYWSHITGRGNVL